MAKFATPWTFVEHEESLEIRDADDQSLSFSYFDDMENRAKIRKRVSRLLALRYVEWVIGTPERFREGKPAEPPNDPPWSYIERPGMIEVRDATGQALGHTYFQTAESQAQGRRWINRDQALSFARWVVGTPERFQAP